MNRKRGVAGIALVVWILLSGSFASMGQTLRIAVAANAQFVTDSLKAAFEKQIRVKIETIVSSSGKLTAQIGHGAPYDIFLSADMKYPQAIYQSGNALDKPEVYAFGQLVLWTVNNVKLDERMEALRSGSVKTIAVANPAIAPYGVAAIAALQKLGIYDKVKNKIVYGESIAQVNQYLLSGVADVAFTAKSIVESPRLNGKGSWVDVPGNLYKPIEQGVVILKHAKSHNLKAAEAFYHFLFSKEGKAIFRAFGYQVP